MSDQTPAAPTMGIEDLTSEAALAAACNATGLSDYGDRGFVEGLSVFLEDLRTHASLNQQGIVGQFQDIVRLLSNRLGFQRDLVRHPEILDETIEKPIIIFGLPRTGSSKLQRMIAGDPQAQRLEVWRLLFPAPFPGTEGISPDPRIAVAEQIEAMMIQLNPVAVAAHPMEAREPDEELWLMEMTFESVISSLKCRAPGHRAWLQKRSQVPAYSYMRSLLQYLQWQDGGARGRPWILKSPVHIGELPTILEVFSDATIVHCHRDPRKVIPSFASLLEHSRMMHTDHIDPVEMGADFNAFWARQVQRNLAARRELGEAQIVDVYFDDIRDRPEAVIAEIYRRADRTITPAAATAFADYGKRRPENHFGKHQYTMEHYGLNAESIDAAFADYTQRFPRVLADRG